MARTKQTARKTSTGSYPKKSLREAQAESAHPYARTIPNTKAILGFDDFRNHTHSVAAADKELGRCSDALEVVNDMHDRGAIDKTRVNEAIHAIHRRERILHHAKEQLQREETMSYRPSPQEDPAHGTGV